ncbi:hypothetical protein V8F20_012388 [Naviculisporaceae sp. PSN 640]
MGSRRLTTLLLGVAVLFFSGAALATTVSANNTVLAAQANNTVHTSGSLLVKREQDTYTIPTYNYVDDDLLADALHCLFDWCDADNALPKKGGMARCRTPGRYGAEVFLCNYGPVRRCSGIELSKAIAELRMVGSPTGAVINDPDMSGGLLFGFEYFCKQGHPACREQGFDATREHCNAQLFSNRHFIYDNVADRRRGTGDFSYIGYSWITQPTTPASQYTYGFKTVSSPSDATPKVHARQEEPLPAAVAFPSGAGSKERRRIPVHPGRIWLTKLPPGWPAISSSSLAPTPTPVPPVRAI